MDTHDRGAERSCGWSALRSDHRRRRQHGSRTKTVSLSFINFAESEIQLDAYRMAHFQVAWGQGRVTVLLLGSSRVIEARVELLDLFTDHLQICKVTTS